MREAPYVSKISILTYSLDLSVERVAALAQENALPEPTLDLGSLPPSNSTFGDIMQMPPPIAARGYSTEDPWASRFTSPPALPKPPAAFGNQTNGTSSISGTGLPRDWWKKQETVFVNVLGQQGFILNRYLVYEVSSDVRSLCIKPSSLTHVYLCLARSACPAPLLRVCLLVGCTGKALSFPITPCLASQADRP